MASTVYLWKLVKEAVRLLQEDGIENEAERSEASKTDKTTYI